MPRTARDVVFVDGVRTPFGKAGPNGLYAETRADNMVVSVIRELLRRNPALPPERIGEVAIAATTQTGDQAHALGIADAMFEPADFLAESLRWAARVLTGEVSVTRAPVEEDWDQAVGCRFGASCAKAARPGGSGPDGGLPARLHRR